MRRQVVAPATGDSRRRAQEGIGYRMADLVIEREVLIEAPAEVVWRTITEPDQMTQWFADRVELVVEPGAHGFMGSGIRVGRSSWRRSIHRLASHSAGTIPAGRNP
jgi:hypothetical protein